MSKSVKIITACAACAAAVGLGAYVYSLRNTDEAVPTYSSVEEPQTTMPTEPPVVTLPDNWADSIDYMPSSNGMTGRAKMMLQQNQDVIGWIKMPGTEIDYPVVLDPGDIPANTPFYGEESYITNSYYLNHDLDGSIFREGALFMDFRNIFADNEAEQSENIMIYGHDMANNNMFGSLRRFWQNYEHYNTNRFIELSSNYRDYDYVIFAFLITIGKYDETDFVYWNMEELDTQEQFDFYVNRCQSESLVDTGVDVEYGDKLLTLSTCYNNIDKYKFIVVARRLRDGESAEDFSTITMTEEYIKAQQEKEAEEKAKKEAEEKAGNAAE